MAWKNDCMAVQEFENNYTDTAPAPIGAAWSQAGIAYSSVVKHDGSYSRSGGYVYCTGAHALLNYVQTKTTGFIVFEFWVLPATNQEASHYYANYAGFVIGTLISTSQLQITWNNGTNYYDISATMGTWNHIAVKYDYANNRVTYYLNNSVIGIINSAGNCLPGSSYVLFGYGYASAGNAYLDNFIISDSDKTSFPTLPISTPTVTDCTSPKYVTGGETITVTGNGFVTGAVVTIDGVDLSTTFVSSTSLTATTEAITAGTYDVTVTNSDTGTATLTNGIEFIPALILTSCIPNFGKITGLKEVTLTGLGFESGAVVTFDTDEATDVVVVSETEITCKTPAHAAGMVDVTITLLDLSFVTLEDGFTYSAEPYAGAATIYEKNRLSSNGVWIVLLELSGGGIGSTLRITKNTEAVVWPEGGNTWQPFPFVLGELSSNVNGEIPSLEIQVSNVTREIQAALEATDGASGAIITIRVVHSDHLEDTDPIWQGNYSILSSVCDEKWAVFSCGLSYPVTSRLPKKNFQKYICQFSYGDIRCNVAAATKITYPVCNKSLGDCKTRENEERYGGEFNIRGGYLG